MRLLELNRRGAVGLLAAGAVLLAFVAPAGAATYPAGGGAFAAGAEGWQETGASCSIPLGTCTASGGHDSEAGNPPGSLAARTSVGLNVGGLFSSSVTLQSPDFTVAEGGAAVLHVDRQFSPAALLSLAPQAEYTVSLIDRGTGVPSEAIAESLGAADAAFAGKDGSAAVVAGRTYAIAIAATTGSTSIGLDVLGEATARFDNVALTTSTGAAGGGVIAGSGSSSSGTSSARRHVFVKVRCPRRPRRACLITAYGRIGRKTRVTYRRTVRVAKGRSKVVGLRVKPRFRQRVLQRKRLVVVQRVRIGKRSRTFSRSRALIRR